MKKTLFTLTLVLTGIFGTVLYAQSPNKKAADPNATSYEEITIRRPANSKEKITIEIDGSSILVNGKPFSNGSASRNGATPLPVPEAIEEFKRNMAAQGADRTMLIKEAAITEVVKKKGLSGPFNNGYFGDINFNLGYSK